jgi:hypothetical protein
MKRMGRYPTAAGILSGAACFLALVASEAATLHVDSFLGSDTNPGTAGQPLKTLERAAEKANEQVEPGAMTIKLAGGIYALPKTVVLENHRAFRKEQRLSIEASISPDDPSWNPHMMPTILSIEDPRRPDQAGKRTSTYGLKIKMSHVTVRGLKFLGSPLANNWYCPLECLATDLKDVVVTQCMFVGDPDTLDIYCAVITDGHQFVVDHCIFSGCHACVVFWDGGRGVVGRGNAMRYCIVDAAKLSGVWTCDTDEDFEFDRNVITRCEYFWLRKRGTPKTYLVRNSVVTENRHYSGYAVESGATGITGPEIRFVEEGVLKAGKVELEMKRGGRDYLHVVRGALGADLGAGLFTKAQPAQ